jgi:hypothetical protein
MLFRAFYPPAGTILRRLHHYQHHSMSSMSSLVPLHAVYRTAGTVTHHLHYRRYCSVISISFHLRHLRLRQTSASGQPVQDEDLLSEGTASMTADTRCITDDREENDGGE